MALTRASQDDAGAMAPELEVADLAALEPVLRLSGRNLTKADVLCYELQGETVAVKTYLPRPFWIRQSVGRWLTSRETRAYRAAAGIEGVPIFRGRLGPYALATRWVEGQVLANLQGRTVPEDTFDTLARILARLHARGIAVADLHHRDVLVAGDGMVHLVDFAMALTLGSRRSRLRRALFERLKELDLVALARMRARWSGRDVEAAVGSVGERAASWHTRGRKLKSLWDRIRGKRTGDGRAKLGGK